MRHQPFSSHASAPAEAAGHVAQLRQVLELVAQIADQPKPAAPALDEGARIAGAYESAPPVLQRRFSALAEEVAAWAAAGVQALLAAGSDAHPPRAAAARLAEEIACSLNRLTGLVRL